MDLYPDCTHPSTYLSEEGYECYDCGLVLGHSWGSISLLRARLAKVESFLNEDDGPARWFLNASRERRALVKRISTLEGATK